MSDEQFNEANRQVTPDAEADWALIAEINAVLADHAAINTDGQPTIEQLEAMLNAPDRLWEIALNADGSISTKMGGTIAELARRARNQLRNQLLLIKELERANAQLFAHGEKMYAQLEAARSLQSPHQTIQRVYGMTPRCDSCGAIFEECCCPKVDK